MASTGNRTADNPLSGHGKAPGPLQSFSIEAIISTTAPATEAERRKAFTSVELRRDGPPRTPRTPLQWTRGYPDSFACPKTFPPGLPRSIQTSLPLAMGFGGDVQARHYRSHQGPLRVPVASFPSMATPWSAYRALYHAGGKAEAFTNWIMSRPDVCLGSMVPGKYFSSNFREILCNIEKTLF